MNLSLRHLELFVAVARLGSLSEAAGRTGVGTAAASMTLSSLEELCGGPLFTRAGRGLKINDRGRRLLPGAEGLVLGAAEWLSSARGRPGELTGELRLGCSMTVGAYGIPPLLPAFGTLHPKARISLQITNSADVAAALRRGSVDLGLIESEEVPFDLECRIWGKDELVLVAPPGHSLARRRHRPFSPGELGGQTWVQREPGSGTRRLASVFLSKVPGLAGMHELGSTEAVKQGVAAGLGLALLSRCCVKAELATGRLVELPLKRRLQRIFHLIWVPGQHTSTLAAGFRTWLLDHPPKAE